MKVSETRSFVLSLSSEPYLASSLVAKTTSAYPDGEGRDGKWSEVEMTVPERGEREVSDAYNLLLDSTTRAAYRR